MAVSAAEWLICYDIRDPRRLTRIHRCCRRYAMPLQLSVFAARLSERRLQELMDRLEQLMDPDVDDIRIYPIGNLNDSILFGTSRLPPMLEAIIKFQQNSNTETLTQRRKDAS